jgi:hypothetical protein
MDDLVLADPSKALLQFYERCIRQTAAQTLVPEAKIRVWFERALVTPAATRGTVFGGKLRLKVCPMRPSIYSKTCISYVQRYAEAGDGTS